MPGVVIQKYLDQSVVLQIDIPPGGNVVGGDPTLRVIPDVDVLSPSDLEALANEQAMLALLQSLQQLPGTPLKIEDAGRWDQVVCITLVHVLQIAPQEAVALLLKPSLRAEHDGRRKRVRRTLLYDVVGLLATSMCMLR